MIEGSWKSQDGTAGSATLDGRVASKGWIPTMRSSQRESDPRHRTGWDRSRQTDRASSAGAEPAFGASSTPGRQREATSGEHLSLTRPTINEAHGVFDSVVFIELSMIEARRRRRSQLLASLLVKVFGKIPGLGIFGVKPTTPIAIERCAGPVYLSHGEADAVWSVACTRRLEARLKAAGRGSEVHYYLVEDHGLCPAVDNVQRARMLAFLRRHLESRLDPAGKGSRAWQMSG